MSDIFSLKKEVFATLKKYITENYTLTSECKVKQYVENNTYPLVVFINNSNVLSIKTIDRMYKTRNLSFTIEIYAINVENIDSQEICEELSNLCIEVMQNHFNMDGGLTARMTNINTAKASKYILHFDCEWWVNKNRIF